MESQHENGIRNRFEDLKAVRTKAENGLKMTGEEDEEQPLSPWASAFRESGSDLYIVTILGSKTRPDPGFVKQNLPRNVLQNPRFSSLQVMDEKSGKMKWVKTSIDMDDHVIVSEENLNQKVVSAEKFLEDYISNLSKKPMNNSKPLWEFHILNLRVYDSESVGVFRIHHSLGDGFSLLTHLLASTRKVSDPEALPSFPVKKKMMNQETNERGFWRNLFVRLWWVLGLCWNTAVDAAMLMATAFFLKDTETPLTRSTTTGSSSSSSRRFIYKSFNLDDIKLVKNATSSTINDVILGVLQRGLSVYLDRIYGEANHADKATEKSNNLPNNIRFRAIVPVSLRLPKLQGLSDGRKENQEKEIKGNKFGYVVLPLTIAIKDDPLDYVRSAKAIMDRKKHSLEAILTSTIAKFLLDLFGTKGASLLSYKIPSHTTMVFSNVPGPREEISYLGYPLSFIAPTSYGLPNGLSVHVLSYSNKLSIVLSVDESTVSDSHQLGYDLEESLILIKEAAIES